MVPIPDVLCGLGAATALVSIPLALGTIPMNRAYGVRFREAFVSQRNWYELNAFAGKLLVAFGAFLVAVGVLTRDLAPPPTSLWAPLFMVGPLLALLPVLALIRVRARRLPDRLPEGHESTRG